MIKMNEEEFKNYIGNNIKSISSKISLEEINFLNSLVNAFNEVCMKYDKSQNNWNELKEWAEERIKNANEYLNDPDKNWDEDANGYVLARKFQSEETLKKMQELEQGKDE